MENKSEIAITVDGVEFVYLTRPISRPDISSMGVRAKASFKPVENMCMFCRITDMHIARQK